MPIEITEHMETMPGGHPSILATIPLHPILFAAYFVLALLGHNITQLSLRAGVRSLLIVLAAAGLLMVLLRLIIKSWPRAALATSLLLGLFFTYGHVYDFLEKNLSILGHHRLLLPVWLLLAVLGLWLVSRRVKSLTPLTMALNITALVALIFPIYQVTHWELLQAQMDENAPVNVPGIGNLRRGPGLTLPDVYFIVLDSYARQDLLQDVYSYDNSAFLDDLRQMGFTIVECSQSNYSQTAMVLASTLNMNYLDQLGKFDTSTQGNSALRNLIRANAVMSAFKALGYQLVSFETGYPFSEFTSADYYLSPGDENHATFGRMNAFEVMLVKSTLSLALTDFAKILPPFLVPDTTQPLETKRQQVLFDLAKLETIPEELPTPKFVFAHLLVTHEPYVFSADGSAIDYPEEMSTEQTYTAYRNQLDFINNRIVSALRLIIENSQPAPIIILQGDTGPGIVSHSGRMSNLSAFYLPGTDQGIPQTLTPVNNFRLVFDRYFGTSLGMLPDSSYFSLYTSPYDYELVPNECIVKP